MLVFVNAQRCIESGKLSRDRDQNLLPSVLTALPFVSEVFLDQPQVIELP